MTKKVLFWDFDGTLGFHIGGMWGEVFLEALNDLDPDHQWTIEDIRPFVQKGFPWHETEKGHLHLNTPELWWNHLKWTVIIKSFMGLGYPEPASRALAELVHQKYTDVTCWSLFDDVRPVLQLLAEEGWQHAIVSNHVPELERIIHSLGLSDVISIVINSAHVGYEKPHPEIYKKALEKTGHPEEVWMIGDNFNADVIGAEAAGIKGILVRKHHVNANFQCETLVQIPHILKGPSFLNK